MLQSVHMHTHTVQKHPHAHLIFIKCATLHIYDSTIKCKKKCKYYLTFEIKIRAKKSYNNLSIFFELILTLQLLYYETINKKYLMAYKKVNKGVKAKFKTK